MNVPSIEFFHNIFVYQSIYQLLSQTPKTPTPTSLTNPSPFPSPLLLFQLHSLCTNPHHFNSTSPAHETPPQLTLSLNPQHSSSTSPAHRIPAQQAVLPHPPRRDHTASSPTQPPTPQPQYLPRASARQTPDTALRHGWRPRANPRGRPRRNPPRRFPTRNPAAAGKPGTGLRHGW